MSSKPPDGARTDANADPSDWVRAAVATHERGLVLCAMRITGDLERARDVAQETFLRLCDQDRAAIEPRLAEWLYTVCRNRAIDIRRKEKRMTPHESPEELGPSSHREAGPAAVLERDEAVLGVLELLALLPRNQQEVIRLKFQQCLSYREISAVTELSVSNVGYLIHMGLKSLRAKLGRRQLGGLVS